MGCSSSASLLSSEEDEDAPPPLPLPLRVRTRGNQHAACASSARDAGRAPGVVGDGGGFAQLALQRRYLLVQRVERAGRHGPLTRRYRRVRCRLRITRHARGAAHGALPDAPARETRAEGGAF